MTALASFPAGPLPRVLGPLVLGVSLLLPGRALVQAQDMSDVTGTVIGAENGDLLGGADVRLRRVEVPEVVRTTSTSRYGTYQFPNVPPGTYVLDVQLLGYEAHQRPVTIRFGENRVIDVELTRDEASFKTVVVGSSQRAERALDVPASVSVLDEETIRREGVTSPVEGMTPTVGTDVAQTGVERHALALRGFGDPFFGTPLTLVDGHVGSAPILGTTAFNAMPILPLDLDRIEVVRGSGTPVYGPESSGGVIQFFTRDPFREPGTSASLAGGTRSFFNAQVRRAGVLNGDVGYKITGQFSRADEWELDPDSRQDAAEIARYRTFAPSDPLPADRTVVDRQLRRQDEYRRYNVNGLLDYRLDRDLSVALRGGYTSLTSTLQTGIGTVQTDELGLAYGRVRLKAGSFVAQAGVSGNLDEGDTYLLRTGESVLDRGTQWTARLQYDERIEDLDTHVLVGGDLRITRPETGTETLIEEDGDQLGRFGSYAQTTAHLAPRLTLTLGVRTDYNDVADEASFAPRGALVYDLSSTHALRASYVRSVSYPGTDPLFVAGRFGVNATEATTGQTVELGYKGTFGDRLRVQLDGFYKEKREVLTPFEDDAGQLAYGRLNDLRYGGVDASLKVQLDETATAFANVSMASDDKFHGDEPGGLQAALGAPTFKAKWGFDYGLPNGFSAGATARYVDDFPVRWGPFVGQVDSYAVLDVRVGNALPGLPASHVDLLAKNVLDNDHREFVGAPALGRRIMARFVFELP